MKKKPGMNLKNDFLWGVFFLLIAACNQPAEKITFQAHSNHDNLARAALYMHFSAEYKALALQTYQMATERLKTIREENPEKENLAVVVDIDETVLDNTPVIATHMREKALYDTSLWNDWCKMAVARPVPGAVAFLQTADSLGFTVFYVSNRFDYASFFPTLENLKNTGFPQVREEGLLLKKNTSDKTARREKISEKHEIALLVGDNLGDFYEDAGSRAERHQVVNKNKGLLGKKYIILPNPMYGNWHCALPASSAHQMDSLINIMLEIYALQP